MDACRRAGRGAGFLRDSRPTLIVLRGWFTWVVLGALVVLGVFVAVDALRSSDREPTASVPTLTEAVTTRQTPTGADLESSVELQEFRVVRLTPGRATTGESFRPVVTFTVPPGWYGHLGGGRRLADGGFAIGKSLSPGAAGVDFASGGIAVEAFDRRLPYALRGLETTAGIRVHDVSQVRIGGYSGRQYGVVFHRPLAPRRVGRPLQCSAGRAPHIAERWPQDAPYSTGIRY